jgi:hypothetical protein
LAECGSTGIFRWLAILYIDLLEPRALRIIDRLVGLGWARLQLGWAVCMGFDWRSWVGERASGVEPH